MIQKSSENDWKNDKVTSIERYFEWIIKEESINLNYLSLPSCDLSGIESKKSCAFELSCEK